MNLERKKELEALFINEPSEDWRIGLLPEEAQLVASWDKQYREAKQRMEQMTEQKSIKITLE